MFNLILVRDDGVRFESGMHIKECSQFPGELISEKITYTETENTIFIRFPKEMFFVIYLSEFSGRPNNIEFFWTYTSNRRNRFYLHTSENLSQIQKIKLFARMYSTFDVCKKLERSLSLFPVSVFTSRIILLLSKLNSFEIHNDDGKTICNIGNGSIAIECTRIMGKGVRFVNRDGKEIGEQPCNIENCKKLLSSHEKETISTFMNDGYSSFIGKILLTGKTRS